MYTPGIWLRSVCRSISSSLSRRLAGVVGRDFSFFFVYCYFAMYTWYCYLTVRLKHLRFQGVLSSHVTLYYLTFFLLLGFQYGWHGWRVCFFFLVLILFCVTVLKG
jgi:hypothetical protein